MFNNQKYRDYCNTYASDIPLFHQPWWLDAVAGEDQWQGLVSDSIFQGKASILPICLTKKWGFSKIHKPLLTTYQGPMWAGYAQLSPSEQIKMVHKTWPELIERVPSVSSFRHTLFPDFQYAFPFHEAGFQVNVRYTYTIDLNQPIELIYDNFRRDVKRKIKHQWGAYQIVESGDLGLFFPLMEKVYQRQNRRPPFTYVFLNHLFSKGLQKEQTKLFLLQNSAQKKLGGVLLFFDHQRVYLLASGLNEEGRKIGAFHHLVWYALKYFSGSRSVFDFCGSMIPNVADSNRSFGGVVAGYLELRKENRWLKAIKN
ncbi:GNAT family N-acetyltransferase [Lewinella cohaerens]|uniref:GNAT family N-acetyltransferase n=1 Tax=Lewinella cohaerens TaxID=70995 RepID=UPI00037CCCAA|nr:GNAT family N-acetyltransferase [Lewinella cohaerens]